MAKKKAGGHGKFVKVFKKFFHSEVHRTMSDGAFRLWIHLLSERPWHENRLGSVVTFPISKQKEFGWSPGRFRRYRDELLKLGIISIRPEDQVGRFPVKEPIRYRIEFDGSNGKSLDDKLERGEIEARQDGRQRRKTGRDPVTGRFVQTEVKLDGKVVRKSTQGRPK